MTTIRVPRSHPLSSTPKHIAIDVPRAINRLDIDLAHEEITKPEELYRPYTIVSTHPLFIFLDCG